MSEVKTWSQNQLNCFEFVENGTGNALIEAVAGAGKSTTIVECSRRMNGKVFLAAFNKKMADELCERVADIPDVYAGTFHSAGFKSLRFAFGKDNALTVDGNKVQMIAEAIRDDNRPDLGSYVTGVCAMVSMAKQRGIGPLRDIADTAAWIEMIEMFNMADAFPEDANLTKAIKYAQVVLKRSNASLVTIDFDDMVYLPLLLKVRMLQHEWVLIDEAQDTNPTRRELAKRMLRPRGRLIAVGDPHQAIFGFTGADNDALEQIADEFDCRRLPLTVTYRCPKSVVEYAHKWVSHIQAHETAPDGSVRSAEYDAILTAKPGDAILSPYTKYLVEACFKLIRIGTPAKIEGRSIGDGLVKLAGRWKLKNITALKEKLEEYRAREVKKAMDKKNSNRADMIDDQVETMYVLIERATATGVTTVEGLKEMIQSIFTDDGNARDVVNLCSGHRSKGLEWNRVFIIGMELLPSPYAKLEWQVQQCMNLCYVMVTRAMNELITIMAPAKVKETKCI